jgi:heat-inducible transcriptional repressor
MPLMQHHGNSAAAGHHDGAVGQCVRADRHHDQHIEARVDDGPATGQRVGGGAGGAGHHESIAAVGIDVAAIHAGLEVEDAAGFPLGEHHIVEGELTDFAAIRGNHPRVEQWPMVGLTAAFKRGVHALEHVLRHDISEETKPAPVDSQHRSAAGSEKAGRVEQRAISPDDNGKLGSRHQIIVVDYRDQIAEIDTGRRALDQRGEAARAQMRQQRGCGIAHGGFFEPPQEGAGVDRAAHVLPVYKGRYGGHGPFFAGYVRNAVACITLDREWHARIACPTPMESRDESQLSDRAQQLLKVLIESYIRDGQPVGSRSLSRESGMSLSSATIRNVMADLEAFGFVSSPHTSAGRVPTPKGYRFFIDTLLQVQPLERVAADELRSQLQSSEDPRTLVSMASQLLSNVTQMAGVVSMQTPRPASLTHIEFMPLSEQRLLAILVFDNREVQNRVVHLERQVSPEDLRRAATALNEQFLGRTLEQVRQELIDQLSEMREHLNQGMVDTISVAQQLFAGEPRRNDMELVIAGETKLMGFAELSSVEKLRRLFEAFNEKRTILQLLDMSLRGQGVQIFIGRESGYQILDDCSVVTAPYSSDTGAVGVIGVIGPTRMSYERVIPVVDLTAKLLGAALNSRR